MKLLESVRSFEILLEDSSIYKPLPRLLEYEMILNEFNEMEDCLDYDDWSFISGFESAGEEEVQPFTGRTKTAPEVTISFTAELLDHIQFTRYWQPRNMIPTIINLSVWFNQPRFRSGRKVKKAFRMSRSAFMKLLILIKDNLVFRNNSPCSPQTEVIYQLATYLYHLGSKLAGGSLEQVGDTLGIGSGTVISFCRRVVHAIHQLRCDFIKWPTVEEKIAHKQRVCAASKSVFSNCVGFVDGTFITLQYAPLKDWFFYYNRKASYALNAMVVCNDNQRILYIRAGDASAVHDTRVYANSQLSQRSDSFFNDGEYLLGDSAYTPTEHMVPPFKKPRSANSDCRLFNAILSSTRRITIEHVFGMLKAQFPSVTSVPIHITGDRSHQEVVA